MSIHKIALTSSEQADRDNHPLPFTNSSQLLLDLEPSCSRVGPQHNHKKDWVVSKLNTNILQCHQHVQSAKGTRDHQFSRVTCPHLSEVPRKHDWVRIGSSICSSRISSRSSSLLDSSTSPIPAENHSLPPLIQYDDLRNNYRLEYSDSLASFGVNTSEKLEDLIVTEHLKKIHEYFCLLELGYNRFTITQIEFNSLLTQLLSLKNYHSSELNDLFRKIDYDSIGYIGWDKFCTYMHLELCVREKVISKQKQVPLPSLFSPEGGHTPHTGNKIEKILFLSDGSMMSLSKDGILVHWTKLLSVDRVKQPEHTYRPRPKWITDFVIMQTQSKIALSTGDHEIQFYELSSFDPCCQLTGFESVPVCIFYSPETNSSERCLIATGDDNGCITILYFSNVCGCLRLWNKFPTNNGIPSLSLEKAKLLPDTFIYIKWKMHQDWVNDLKFFPEIDSTISCCSDPSTSLVIAKTFGRTDVREAMKDLHLPSLQAPSIVSLSRKTFSNPFPVKKHLPGDEIIFKIRKGVKSFDYNKLLNILATGGSDRIIRVWNPYIPHHPIARLSGHQSGIHFLAIHYIEKRLISIDIEKNVRVWDLTEFSCLLNFGDKFHKITSDILACSLNHNQLVVCSDFPTILTFNTQVRLHCSTHQSKVIRALYNQCFDCVVSACDGSVVKIWDLSTGNFHFEFTDLHPGGGITCMSFDNSGRRLITGSNNGEVKIWNFNNGQFLKFLDKGNAKEVTDVAYVNIHTNQYIITVGWDRQLHIFSDLPENIHTRQTENKEWKLNNQYSINSLDGNNRNIGHKDDILAVAYGLPNFLATSSYDGEIIVWSMLSGHVFCRMKVEEDSFPHINTDLPISNLLFLDTRAGMRNSGSLVSNGPFGQIYFWNLYNGCNPRAKFQGTKDFSITCITSDINNLILGSGNSDGSISLWDIHNFCMEGVTEQSPFILRTWRAHIQKITSLNILEKQAFIISASIDHNVRLWTLKSQFIGTFGIDTWNVHDISTFKHPHSPEDVLKEPMKVQLCKNILGFNEPQSCREITYTDENNEDKIDLIIDTDRFLSGISGGKRLRNEKKRSSSKDCTGRTYQSISINDIQLVPQNESLDYLICSKSKGVFLTDESK